MDNQIQGGVIGSAVFAPRHPERTSLEEALHAVTHANLRDAGIAIERRACIRTGRAAPALRPLQHPAGGAYADARMCRTGGGTAEVTKQIIGNALLPKIRKAN